MVALTIAVSSLLGQHRAIIQLEMGRLPLLSEECHEKPSCMPEGNHSVKAGRNSDLGADARELNLA